MAGQKNITNMVKYMGFSSSSSGPGLGLLLTEGMSLKSLAVSSDTISAAHTINFCTPVPNDAFNCPGNVPATKDCGVFTKDFKNFPLDDPPSGGPCVNPIRISPSEMAYIFLQLNNYIGSGTIDIVWRNKDTGTQFFPFSWNVPACGGNCTNMYWYVWVWAFVGHFDWEINVPGNYQVIINTTWGNATVDFTVIDTSCVPDWQCELPLNGYEYDGCGNRRANAACNPAPPQTGTINITGCGNVFVGQTCQLTAVCKDANGVITNPPLTWKSSTPTIATISASGLVTAISPGFVNFTASSQGYTDSTISRFIQQPYKEATLVSCQWPTGTLVLGQPYELVILVNQGSITEGYKIVFSGGYTGDSTPFMVTAGTGQ
ncbi:MAG: Ig-like domain-containing protein, partial [Desulfocapsaceae bacterium]|nr:Ig-like domain-containing protein [Desulfocapsaceae bacterium]